MAEACGCSCVCAHNNSTIEFTHENCPCWGEALWHCRKKSLKTTPSLVWYRRYDFTVSVHKHHLKQKPSMMPPHPMNLSAHIYLWSNLSILICCWSSFQWTPPVLVSWRHRLGMGLSIVDDTATWRKLDSHLICLSFYIHDHSWYDETTHSGVANSPLFLQQNVYNLWVAKPNASWKNSLWFLKETHRLSVAESRLRTAIFHVTNKLLCLWPSANENRSTCCRTTIHQIQIQPSQKNLS